MISAEHIALLWHKHAAAITLLCRSRCVSPEDCVQEAFIKLAAQPETPSDPLAWLVRVARNLAVDQTRAENRRGKRETEVGGSRDGWFEQDEVAELSSSEVQNALRQLDNLTRDIVVAHLWANMTFRQIADEFELSNSTAHRLYANGINQLRKALGVEVTDHNI